jgi:hypothetical protein
MSNSSFTRTGLESLTTGELVKLADFYGLDIPPGLDRLFIIEELLEITLEGEGRGKQSFSEEPLVTDTGFLESVPLPRQYNITFIEVMVRDPLWAFVFWEIKTFDKEIFEKAPDFGGYYLKVSPWESGGNFPRAKGEGVFTVPVETGDTARYLSFPPEGDAEGQKENPQKVELCARRDIEEFVLAVSDPFRLPSLPLLPVGPEQEEHCKRYKNPLVRLSGCGDFHILRNPDRFFRLKRDGSMVDIE